MTPQFQVYQDAQGGFRWRLLTSGGRTLAASHDRYASKADVLHGVQRIQANDLSGTAQVFQDRNGRFRWRQALPDGTVLAAGGESFSRFDDCAASVGFVHSLASGAPIQDLTEELPLQHA